MDRFITATDLQLMEHAWEMVHQVVHETTLKVCPTQESNLESRDHQLKFSLD